MHKILLTLFLSGASLCANALLVHQYTFDSADPYADSVGGADLAESGGTGAITSNPDGYISFAGAEVSDQNGINYLSSTEVFSSVYDPFVLSITFRTANPTGQYDWASLFSSNPSSDSGFQICFQDSYLQIKGDTDVSILSLDQLAADEWHVITIEQSASGGEVWLDDTQYVSDAYFGDLNAFRIGTNRNGRKQFAGDISEVSIYNSEEWSSDKQAAVYSSAIAIPEPAAVSLVILFGTSTLFIRRFFD